MFSGCLKIILMKMKKMTTKNPVSLLRRLFALAYESLLIGSVTLLTLLVLGMLQTFIQQQVALPLAVFSLVYVVALLGAWWFYFKMNWVREQQTLPMRVWKIGLQSVSGSRATVRELRLRFMWACVFLVFVPLAAYAVFRFVMGVSPRAAMGLALLWWILPWGFAKFNPRKQFLYDYLAGTELVDWREKETAKF